MIFQAKKIIIAICSISVGLFIAAIAVFRYCHPTHYKFNDRFVIGSTSEEITNKYGDFYHVRFGEDNQITSAEYMIHDNEPEWIMGYDDSLWYVLEFKDGIVTDVHLREGWIGG